MKKTGILLLTIISLFFFLVNGNSNSENIKVVEAETETLADTGDSYNVIYHPNGGTSFEDNLVPYPHTYSTRTANGLTFTDNGDGTVTVNGTYTAVGTENHTDYVVCEITLSAGTYYLTGGTTNVSDNVNFCSSDRKFADTTGNGDKFTLTSEKTIQFKLIIAINTPVDNVIFTPTIIEIKPETHTYGQPKALAENKYVREGYTFVGWNTKADGSGYFYSDEEEVSNLTTTDGATITLYAQWKANPYTIVFDGNGSTSGSTESVAATYDKTATLTKNGFQRAGYTFTGWNTKADGTGTAYTNKQSVNIATDEDATVTLYAQWKAKTWTVSFDANGGSVATANKTVTFGSTYGTLPTPTRPGYTFAGWKMVGKLPVNSWSAGDNNFAFNNVLYGVIPGTTYNINIEQVEIGIGSEFTIRLYDFTTSKDLVTPIPKNEGSNINFDITCPNTADATHDIRIIVYAGKAASTAGNSIEISNCTAVPNTYTTNTTIVNATANHNLIAQWTPNTSTPYKVEHYQMNLDGSTYTLVDTQYLKGTTGASVTPAVKEYEGFTAPSAQTETIAGDGSTVIRYEYSRKIYSFDVNYLLDGNGIDWNSNPKVSAVGKFDIAVDGKDKIVGKSDCYFNMKEGNGVYYGTEYEISNIIPLAGYSYNYSIVIDGVSYSAGTTYRGTFTGQHIYITWISNKYTIEFDANGGTGNMGSMSMTYGTAKNLTANGFQKAGYTFAGWNTKADGTGTAYINKQSVNIATDADATVTLYAQWTANTYNVKYNSGNLLYGLEDISDMSSHYIRYSISNGRVTVESSYKDGYGYTTGRVYLEAGKTYRFTCNTNGAPWGTLHDSGTVEAWLMLDGSTDGGKYYHMDSTNFPFSVAYTGVYHLRLDVNKAGMTSTFSDISIIDTSMADQTMKYDKSTVLTPNAFTRQYYTFLGWSRSENGDVIYEDNEEVSNIIETSGTVNLYAVWRQNKVSVVYHTNGATYISALDSETLSTMLDYSGVSDEELNDILKVMYDNKVKLNNKWSYNPMVFLAYEEASGNLNYEYGLIDGYNEKEFLMKRTGYVWVDYWCIGDVNGERIWEHVTDKQKADKSFNGIYLANQCGLGDEFKTGDVVVHLYAYWEPIEYTINLNSNDGSNRVSSITGVKYDTPTVLTKNSFDRAGYKFIGWNTQKDGSGDFYLDEEEVVNLTIVEDATINLYAQWAKNTYTIEFDSNDGTGKTELISANFDEFYVLTNEFTRDYCTFKGWSTTPNGEVEYENGAREKNLITTVDGVITLYAVWEQHKVFINYYHNGATEVLIWDKNAYNPSGESPVVQNIFTGKSDKEINDALRVLYNFKLGLKNDWSYNPMVFNAYEEVAGNLNYKWGLANGKNPYELSLGKLGYYWTGEWLVDSPDGKIGIADEPTDEQISNKSFNGIYLAILSGKEDQLKAGNITIDLYANWTPITYTVIFDANGGIDSDSMGDLRLDYDQTYSLPACTFTKNGYTFNGWLGSNGKTYADKQSVTNLSSTLNATITLTAQWTANTYTIKFDGNGRTNGSMSNSNVTYDEPFTLPANKFSKTGYVFAGWNTEKDGSGISYTDKESIKNITNAGGEITLYAQWRANEYTIIYHPNGGSLLDGGVSINSSNLIPCPSSEQISSSEGITYTYSTSGIITLNGTASNNSYLNVWGSANNLTFPMGTYILSCENGDSNFKFVSNNWAFQAYGSRTAILSFGGDTAISFNLSVKRGAAGNGIELIPSIQKISQHVYGISQTLDKNVFVRDYYTFLGWSTDPDATTATYKDEASIINPTLSEDGTITLYAVWKPHVVTVIYHPNGADVVKFDGEDYSNSTDQILMKAMQEKYKNAPHSNNSVFFVPDIESRYGLNNDLNEGHLYITRTGYNPRACWVIGDSQGNLTGIYINQDISQDILQDPNYLVAGGFNGEFLAIKSRQQEEYKNGDITIHLYYKWDPNEYEIKFDKNATDAEGNMDSDSMSVIYDNIYSLPENRFTRTGYTFVGWNTKADGSGTSYSNKANVKNLTAVKDATVPLYAQWAKTSSTYTIEFKANGGTGEMNSQQVVNGFLNLNSFKRDYYTFVGWSTKKDATNATFNDGDYITITKNTTLYAVWRQNTVSIVYHPNGATDIIFKGDANNYASYSDEALNEKLTEYYLKKLNGGGQYAFNPMVFNAYEEADGNFNYMYGLININNENEVEFTRTGYDQTVYWYTSIIGGVRINQDPSGAQRASKSFNGLYLAGLCGVDNEFKTGDVVVHLYAQWIPYEYKIVFDDNVDTNDVSGTMDSILATYDVSYALRKNSFTRSGYTFTGWKDENGTYYADGESVKNLTDVKGETVKLYAQWTQNYTVIFDANGGTGSMSNLDIAYGTSVKLPANEFSKIGYIFAGWNTKHNGSGTPNSDKANIKDLTDAGGEITLYAQWTPITYKIEFKPNGGTGSMSTLNVTYETSIKLPANTLQREGYTFVGWNTGVNGTGSFYNDCASVRNLTTTSGAKIILYAQWEINSYKIVFNKNHNNAQGSMPIIEANYGMTYKLLPNTFTLSGHTFIGWNTKPDGTGKFYASEETVMNLTAVKDATVTLYAQWKQFESNVDFLIYYYEQSSSYSRLYLGIQMVIKNSNGVLNNSYDYTFSVYESNDRLVSSNIGATILDKTIICGEELAFDEEYFNDFYYAVLTVKNGDSTVCETKTNLFSINSIANYYLNNKELKDKDNEVIEAIPTHAPLRIIRKYSTGEIISDETTYYPIGSQFDSYAIPNIENATHHFNKIHKGKLIATFDKRYTVISGQMDLYGLTYEIVYTLNLGSGTAQDPFLIRNLDDLLKFRDEMKNTEGNTFGAGKYYKVVNDIDANGQNIIIYTFAGTFDGDNHTISGLNISNTNSNNTGLFKLLKETGVIKNLTVSGFVNGTNNRTGGIVGNNEGTIENCINNAQITGTQEVGGIAGYSKKAITNCINNGSVTGTEIYVGGIVGWIDSASTLKKCINYGNVGGTGTTGVGGIVGCAKSLVSDCTNYGTITGNENIGGIVGETSENSNGVKNCTNHGSITGTSNVGGIVGYNLYKENASISSCSNLGQVSGTSTAVGGLVGQMQGNKITSSSNYGTVTSTSNWVGGVVGYITKGCSITNSHNYGDVTGAQNTAGFVGRFDYNEAATTNISNCSNEGNVTSSGWGSGGFAGFAYNANFRNCINKGNVLSLSSQIGGFVGCLYSSSAANTCHNYGDVTALREVGGVVGFLEGKLINCNNHGKVVGTDRTTRVTLTVDGKPAENGQYTYEFAKYSLTGGIAGVSKTKTTDNVVYYCNNYGEVFGENYTAGIIGGVYEIISETNNDGVQVIKHFELLIEACTNNGKVYGRDCTAGIIGGTYTGVNPSTTNTITIKNCTNNAEIYGRNLVGGILGDNRTVAILLVKDTQYYKVTQVEEGSTATITNCINNNEICGGNYVGGITGNITKNSSITKCENNGDVSGNEYVGGIAARNTCLTENNINNGTIIGKSYVGGVFGILSSNSTNNDNYGDVQATNGSCGGIAGLIQSNINISNCDNYGYIRCCNTSTLGQIYGNKGRYTVTENNNTSTGKVGHACLEKYEWTEDRLKLTYSTECGVTKAVNAIVTIDVNTDGTKAMYTYRAYFNDPFIQDTTVHSSPVALTPSNNIVTVNAPVAEDSRLVPSQDYIKVYVDGKPHSFTVYYSEVDVWDGKTVSTGLQGSGTQADPFLIQSGADLAYFKSVIDSIEGAAGVNYTVNQYKGQYFKMTKSIDLNGANFRIGYHSGWNNYQGFAGIFDGNNCTIRGLNINNTTSSAALFACIQKDGILKNLSVYGSVRGKNNVSGAIAYLLGTAENITNYTTVTQIGIGNETGTVGGIVANAEQTTSNLINCVNYANITADSYSVAGIAGSLGHNAVDCINFGNVKGGDIAIGGIGGTTKGTGTITRCINYGSIESTKATDGGVGGIVGELKNKIVDCVNYGSVSGTEHIGGIAGGRTYKDITEKITINSSITNSINYGKVSGVNYVGGILGGIAVSNESVANLTVNITITKCSNYGEVEGKGYITVENTKKYSTGVGGVVGCVEDVTTTMTFSYNYENINGHVNTGGVIGKISSSINNKVANISDCTNEGNVNASGWGSGGIAGYAVRANFTKCTNKGTVIVTSSQVGGIVGCLYSTSTATDCHNYANVTAKDQVGGVIGYWQGTYTNCTNSGTVNPTEPTGSYPNGSIYGRDAR